MNATPVSSTPATAPTRPTPQQLATFREQLEQQRRFRLEQLAELRSIDPDNTSEVTEVLAAGARSALHDVLGALYRMESGSYGRCVDCDRPVPLERLEVLPQVAQCLSCSRDAAVRSLR